MGGNSSKSKDDEKEDNQLVVLPPNPDHLPAELLQYMQEFQNHMLYFFNSNMSHPPATLIALLDEVSKANESSRLKRSERKARKEVLHDEDGRKLLFMLSFEETMRKMMAAVEQHHPFMEVPFIDTAAIKRLRPSENTTSPSDSTAVAGCSQTSQA